MSHTHIPLPTQGELLFPLLDVLRRHGPLKARDACEAVADEMRIPPQLRAVAVTCGDGQRTNVVQRRIRWVRQNAVMAGLIGSEKFGLWELAERGHKVLVQAKPGILICVAQTDRGAVYWGEALTAMQMVEDESVQMWFTSPPYPLNRQREYRGWHPETWMDTMLKHVDVMGAKLRSDGSLVLNLCDVYERGRPVLSTYQEELVIEMKRRGFCLLGKETWFNPGKPPATNHVTKTRERLKNGVETLFWWSPSDHPKANNRNILVPYSEEFRRTLARGGQVHRTLGGSRQGHPGLRYRIDNGGTIPFNHVTAGAEGANCDYARHCRLNGLPIHPARMPAVLPEQWVQFVTDEGDLVGDPFGGSLQLAAACERFKRRFFTADKVLDYLRGGVFRLRETSGFEQRFDFIDESAAA